MDASKWKLLLAFSLTMNVVGIVFNVKRLYRYFNGANYNPWASRATLFARPQQDTGKIVFLGDSQTQQFELYELLGHPDVRNRGISGNTSGQVLERLDPIIRSMPARVFIQIGTNDLHQGISVETLLRQYRSIAERIRQSNSQTAFYFQSIFPVTTSTRVDKLIQEANRGIRALASQSGATYIDLYTPMAADKGRFLDHDGLHLSAEGYLLWAETVKPYLR